MPVETLSREVGSALNGLAWDMWSRMGVAGARGSDDRRAADPEALIVFTLSVARRDPRLFDELLDWLARNEGVVSTQRLRNLCADAEDTKVVGAAMGWKSSATARPADTEPLFPTASGMINQPDAAFEDFGFLRPAIELSGKSRAPDLLDPINLAFRLRQILGRTARAEVMRSLLTLEAPRVSAAVLTHDAALADRNVREAVNDLADAGAVRVSIVGGTRWYALAGDMWSGWQTRPPARHFDWIPALRAARRVHRWLSDPVRAEASPYLLASDARQLITELETDLRFIGIAPQGVGGPGKEYWETFESIVRSLLAALTRP